MTFLRAFALLVAVTTANCASVSTVVPSVECEVRLTACWKEAGDLREQKDEAVEEKRKLEHDLWSASLDEQFLDREIALLKHQLETPELPPPDLHLSAKGTGQWYEAPEKSPPEGPCEDVLEFCERSKRGLKKTAKNFEKENEKYRVAIEEQEIVNNMLRSVKQLLQGQLAARGVTPSPS